MSKGKDYIPSKEPNSLFYSIYKLHLSFISPFKIIFILGKAWLLLTRLTIAVLFYLNAQNSDREPEAEAAKWYGALIHYIICWAINPIQNPKIYFFPLEDGRMMHLITLVWLLPTPTPTHFPLRSSRGLYLFWDGWRDEDTLSSQNFLMARVLRAWSAL